MAVSAYTPQGLLKKDPLAGTSLASDPNQQVTRQGFQDLYSDAKANAESGGTRQDEINKLQSQANAQAADTNSRLAEIARVQGQFQDQLSAARDPAKEKQLQADVDKWNAYSRNSPTPNAKNWKSQTTPQAIAEAQTSWQKMTPTQKINTGAQMGGKKGYIKDYVLGGKARAQDAASAYEAQFNATVDKINEQYIPLQEEAADRQKRLADRVDLYNLFLGA